MAKRRFFLFWNCKQKNLTLHLFQDYFGPNSTKFDQIRMRFVTIKYAVKWMVRKTFSTWFLNIKTTILHFILRNAHFSLQKSQKDIKISNNNQKILLMPSINKNVLLWSFYLCAEKKEEVTKKITISVQKQFLKLLQPHQGAEPSAGFYILEKVGKRLPPAGSGRKYRVFQLWDYFLWILIL